MKASDSHPPDNYNPKVFLICAKCCKVLNSDLNEKIKLGWVEYLGDNGKFSLCPECDKR